MTQENEQLLCKDCKHSFQLWYDILFFVDKRYSLRCRKSYKTEMSESNPVTGPKIKSAHYETCSTARMNYVSKQYDTNCGEAGRWWQPKNKKDLFKLIKHMEEIK